MHNIFQQQRLKEKKTTHTHNDVGKYDKLGCLKSVKVFIYSSFIFLSISQNVARFVCFNA